MGFADVLAMACVTSDLGSKENHIKPVERVAALSGASSAGSDLFRARNYDQNALRRAYLAIAQDVWRTFKSISRADAHLLAHVAIVEILHTRCHTCHGGGTQGGGKGIGTDQTPERVCPDCGGIGVHRWRDGERAEVAATHAENTPGNHSEWVKLVRYYPRTLAMAQDTDSRTVGAAKKKLG
jgi:hypothetical protein